MNYRAGSEGPSANRIRTRLYVERLEDRTQPSRLLPAGIELGALGDPFENREPPDPKVVVKHFTNSEDTQVVSPELAPAEQRTAPATNIVAASLVLQQPILTAANLVIYKPATAERVMVAGRNLLRTEMAPQPIKPIIRRIDAGSRLGHSNTRSVIHGDDRDSTRSAVWSSYDSPGSNRADKVNAIAVGVGPGAGRTIAVGKQGRIGTIKHYNSSGMLLVSQTIIPSPGNRSEILAVAVDPMDGRGTGDIYVVARETNSDGTLVNHSVQCFPALGGPATTSLIYPPGVTKSLDDITVKALEGRPGLEISVVGTADVGIGYDVVQVSHMTTSLTGVVDVSVDFGAAAQGLSLATNSADTRFIGGRYDNGGIAQPLDFDLEADDQTSNWSHIWSLGSPSNKTSNGFYGMTVVGNQLYTSGSIADAAFNPAIAPDPEDYDNLFVQNVSASTGLVNAYSFGYGIAGGNYSAAGNAVDEDGNQFTAGSVDDSPIQSDVQTLSFADTSQFDTAGDLVAFRDTGDCDGTLNKDSDGRDIAVHNTGDVAVGGETNASKASFEAGLCPAGNPAQLLNGADASYGLTGSQSQGPPSDGYVFRDEVPLGG